jgi:hypothetical protein
LDLWSQTLRWKLWQMSPMLMMWNLIFSPTLALKTGKDLLNSWTTPSSPFRFGKILLWPMKTSSSSGSPPGDRRELRHEDHEFPRRRFVDVVDCDGSVEAHQHVVHDPESALATGPPEWQW